MLTPFKSSNPIIHNAGQANAVAVQKDGKILLAGSRCELIETWGMEQEKQKADEAQLNNSQLRRHSKKIILANKMWPSNS